MPERALVHQLLDAVPDDLLSEVEAYLTAVAGVTPEDAPDDDEPLTAADLATMERSRSEVAAGGRIYSMDEVRTLVDNLVETRGLAQR
ncbi:MAG: hypothetical protein ACKVVT_15280 [Dehalococcoidia bacterium]